MDLRILARYPFLSEGKEVLKEIKLSDLLESPKYERIRSLGVERVKACYTNKRPFIVDDYEKFLSFHMARLILIALADPIITRRFAIVERDRIENSLTSNKEDMDLVAQDLGLRFQKINEVVDEQIYQYKLHFIDFIKYAKNFSTDDFRLINQKLRRGFVLLQTDKFIKIIREAFVENFVEDVLARSEEGKSIRKYFSNEIDEIRNLKDEYISKYTPIEFGEVSVEAFPPCMRTIMAKISQGVNVSHQARFSLVAFLHRVGMNEDDILKIFAGVPDFKKDLTLYQIRHITGKISGKEYMVPKCSTMRSYGLCVKDVANDKLCNKSWMTHPLLYYKIKMEKSKKGSSKQKEDAARR